MGDFQFITTRNYMKKDPSSGTGTMAGPSVSQYFGNYYTTTRVIAHNLGYVPLFRVYYEPYRDGRVMEAFQDTAYYLPTEPNGLKLIEVAPTLMSYADETNLYLELCFVFNTLSGFNFNVHWTIYKDYGML